MPKVNYVDTTALELEIWSDSLRDLSQQFAVAAVVMRTLGIDSIPLGAKEQTSRGVDFVEKAANHLDQAIREGKKQLKRGEHGQG